MEKTAEQVYTELMRQLARPGSVEPGVLADTFREVERLHEIGQITDWQLENAQEAYAKTSSGGRSRLGEAANRAVGQAKEALQSGAGQVRDRAGTAVATYTQRDPLKAMLIAAGVGALLMTLASSLARSGARTVRRTIRR